MPLTTINAAKPKPAAKKKAAVIKDNEEFIVTNAQTGMKLLHQWTDDEGRAQTTEITGICTAGDLRAVKVDLEDWIERGMIERVTADLKRG